MLVLTRKQGSFLVFTVTAPTEFRIHVPEVTGGRAKLAIEAGDDVLVRRGELAPLSHETERRGEMRRAA